jgi:hypothetical protein
MDSYRFPLVPLSLRDTHAGEGQKPTYTSFHSDDSKDGWDLGPHNPSHCSPQPYDKLREPRRADIQSRKIFDDFKNCFLRKINHTTMAFLIRSGSTLYFQPANFSILYTLQMLVFLLMVLHKTKGVRTSGILFMFWLISVCCDVFAFQTNLRDPPEEVIIMLLYLICAVKKVFICH